MTEHRPESITEDELAEALAELGVRINGNAYFPELARNIFGYIGRQREPVPGAASVAAAPSPSLRRPDPVGSRRRPPERNGPL